MALAHAILALIEQEDKPNRKEYSITKTRRAELCRGMTYPIIPMALSLPLGDDHA